MAVIIILHLFPMTQVNPLYDQSGITAVMGANLLFEMLCALPGVKYIKR